MGTCNQSCAISGLPIKRNDRIRYLLLTQNPYEEARAREELHGTWFPRCFPLRAKYNDYDTVEEVEEGPARDLWLEGLKKDLIEKGWGDNSHHDHSALKDMTFEQLLDAVRRGRVCVQPELRTSSVEKLSVDELAKLDLLKEKGLPTLRRVLGILKEHKQQLYEGPDGVGGYMVDDVQYGIVRVRWHSWGGEVPDEVHLREVLPFLGEYATVITAGSGTYAQQADLLVTVKPNDKHLRGPFHVVEKHRELSVAQTMIREDVWQGLLGLSTKADVFRKDAREFIHECLERARENTRLAASLEALAKENPELSSTLKMTGSELSSYLSLILRAGGRNAAGVWISNDAVPFTVGLGTNTQLMLTMCLNGKVTPEQLDSWVESAAEFACIQNLLRETNYWWRPSYRIGPQFGDFRLAEAIHSVFAVIGKRVADEEDAA